MGGVFVEILIDSSHNGGHEKYIKAITYDGQQTRKLKISKLYGGKKSARQS